MKFFPLAALGFSLLTLLSSCTSVETLPSAAVPTPDDPYEQLTVYATVQELLRAYYLNAGSVGYTELTNGALKGMLTSLDNYSAYDTPEEYELTKRELAGEQVGIGIVVAKAEGDHLRVVVALPNTPAAQAGIRAGDFIAGINGRNTAELNLEECMKLMRGEAGTSLTVEVFQNGDFEHAITMELERELFHRSSVPAHSTRMIAEKIGYIQIESFTDQTAAELDLALQTLQEQPLEGLVLDLRNNPGGLLDAAVEVAGRFLPPGQLVVSIEGRLPEENERLFSRKSPVRYNGKLAILINCFSASAAEIVAGSLRDQERATLVGETSFGKGTVQRIFPLPNGGAVRFSIAQYFTPSHRVIHQVGIAPDHEVILTSEEDSLLAEQLLWNPDQPLPEEAAPIEDIQLKAALEALLETQPEAETETPPETATTAAPQPAA